jgi:hypothetical protein
VDTNEDGCRSFPPVKEVYSCAWYSHNSWRVSHGWPYFIAIIYVLIQWPKSLHSS